VVPAGSEAFPGDDVVIRWTLTGSPNGSIGRVSMFAENQGWAFDTRESLVGRVDAGTVRTGNLTVHIPEDTLPGAFAFNVGIATEAEPLALPTHKVTLNVGMKDYPHLVASAVLDDAGSAGGVPGIIEPRERARLVVTLRNDGTVAVSNLGLSIENLTGADIRMPQPQTAIKTIGPGDTWVARFRVEGSPRIMNRLIHLGIAITGADLGDGFHYPATIEARTGSSLEAH
jgi:hypothetical protein